ncbi:MAG: T9SS type A sorting domain-containing protein [Bacteroidetes bacterium]|nr:T9SS type A sorting domain-containing protein [Bacteroidota bacterium]
MKTKTLSPLPDASVRADRIVSLTSPVRGGIILLTVLCFIFHPYGGIKGGLVASCSAQGMWTQKANFGGGARIAAVGFSIGTKGYIGSGRDGSTLYQDFWEWDQATNVWTQKANFGGTPREYAVGFSIGTKGYIGTGSDGITGSKQDFWEWDQATNVWTQKANFGGTARYGAVGFSIGTKGYIGTGEDSYFGPIRDDFWEWDQATNVWTQKANFSGGARYVAVGFSIGTKGYIGLDTMKNDFWEWDQAGNTWTQKANFGGGARNNAVGFSIGTKGYIGTGQDNSYSVTKDFWEWNQATNLWTQKANFGGTARHFAVGFSIGNKGYIGTGGYQFVGDTVFWEFYDINISPGAGNPICSNQCNGTANASASGGTPPYSYSWSTSPIQTTSTATGLCVGTYSVTVSDSIGIATNTVAISDLPPPSAPPICMVTVDSLSQNNIIIWDKTSFASADSFIIYREIGTNNYQRLGAVPYDSLSLFVDTVRAKYFPNTGDPNAGTYRYKLKMRDSCGILSTALSPYHNTIYMLNNSGAFSWLQLYTVEGSSNPVISYILMRDDNSTGAWHAVNSVSGTQQTVIDPSYLTYQTTGSWRIETQWSIACTPTIKNPIAETFISSRSNVYKVAGAGVNSIENDLQITISPNPTSGLFNVQMSGFADVKMNNIEVYNIYGECIHPHIRTFSNQQIDLSSQPNGIYFLQLKTAEGMVAKKIVVQR